MPTTTPKKILGAKNATKRVSSLTLQLNNIPEGNEVSAGTSSPAVVPVSASSSTSSSSSSATTPAPFLPNYFTIEGSLSSSEKSTSSEHRRGHHESRSGSQEGAEDSAAEGTMGNAATSPTSVKRRTPHHQRRKIFTSLQQHDNTRKRTSPLQQALTSSESSLHSTVSTEYSFSSSPHQHFPCAFTHHPNSPFRRRQSTSKSAKKSTLSALLSKSASTTTSALSNAMSIANTALDSTAATTRSPLSASLLSTSLDEGAPSSYASPTSQKHAPSTSATTTPNKQHLHFASVHSETSSSSSAPRAIPSTGASFNSHKSSSVSSSLLTSSLLSNKPPSDLQGSSYTYSGVSAQPHFTTMQQPHNAPIASRDTPPQLFCRRLILSFIRINYQYTTWYLKEKYKRERKCFTTPPEIDPESSNQSDNANGDLVVHSGDLIHDRYFVIDILGTGTFGVVIKCEDLHTGKFFALKVIKNREAYNRQAVVEIRVLEKLRAICDVNEKHLIKMEKSFRFKDHLCIVFELLNINLYELLVQNQYQGLKWVTVRTILKQMLEAMMVLQNYGILHCDLKPENILLRREFATTSSSTSTQQQDGAAQEQGTTDGAPLSSPPLPTLHPPPAGLIKLIDFGSACYEGHTMYSYIQSRFYRSPEVLMGLPYTGAIDMWSLGCIATELFLGLPLFPGHSQHNQVCRIVEVLGFPPQFMIENGKFGHKHFKRSPDTGEWVLKTEEDYCREHGGTPQQTKRYFKYIRLEDLIMNYNKGDKTTTDAQRRALIHFIRGCLNWNPYRRWTVDQAIEHPLIKGDISTNFEQNWTPPPSRKQMLFNGAHAYGSGGSYDSNSGTPTMGGGFMAGYGAIPAMGPSPNFSPYQHVQSSYSPNSGSMRYMYYGSPGQNPGFMGHSNGSYSSGFMHPMAISPQVRPGCVPQTSASYQNFQHQFHHHHNYFLQQHGQPHGGSPYQTGDGLVHSYGSPHYASQGQYFSASYNQASRHAPPMHNASMHHTSSHSYQPSHFANNAPGSYVPNTQFVGSIGGGAPNHNKNARKTRPRSRTWTGHRFNKNAAPTQNPAGNPSGGATKGRNGRHGHNGRGRPRPPQYPEGYNGGEKLPHGSSMTTVDGDKVIQSKETHKDRMEEPWEDTIFEIEDPISDESNRGRRVSSSTDKDESHQNDMSPQRPVQFAKEV